jgi:surface polysaccharide O-acyltransferase-like enzyme
MKQAALRPVAIFTIAVLALQIAVGAGAALTDNGLFNGLHVAIATLVWSGMLSIALLTAPRSDRVAVTSALSAEKGPA